MARSVNIVVIGLGYVGLPLAVALARKFPTVGYDIDAKRISELEEGRDRTREVGEQELRQTSLKLTDRAEDCGGAEVYIVTVPTPVTSSHQPDLGAVLAAAGYNFRLLLTWLRLLSRLMLDVWIAQGRVLNLAVA